MGRSEPSESTRQERVEGILTGSVFATALSALLSIAGVYASLVSTELHDWLRKWLPDPGHRIAMSGVVFAVALSLFFVRQRVVDKRRERVQSDLERSQQRLEELPDLVRTMPSEPFMQDLGIALEKCQVLHDATTCRAELLDSIRVLLYWVAVLARGFDGTQARNARFATNVMIFISAQDAGAWDEKITFASPGTALSGLEGVLALCCDLTSLDTGDLDDQVPEIALPVPKQIGTPKDLGGNGWQALPGAPMAYSQKRFEHFERAAQMADWVRDYGNFPPSVAHEIEAYFGDNPLIAGFLAVPIFEPVAEYTDRERRKVLAVLNLHWSAAARLRRDRAAALFAESIFPLRLLLAKQIERLLSEGTPVPQKCDEIVSS
jgi:hypothetical protein